MHQIGFVGLGAMGSVMAPLPVAAGFLVIAFDTASQLPDLPDITMAAALTDLATCDAIITMLPDQESFCGKAEEVPRKLQDGFDVPSEFPLQPLPPPAPPNEIVGGNRECRRTRDDLRSNGRAR